MLINMDNGKWPNYNFNKALIDSSLSDTVGLRSRKLFYVCCTRAKEELVVFMQNPTPDIILEAKKLFGDNNVMNFDEIKSIQ